MIDEIEQQFQRGGKGDGGVERRIFGRILEEMSGAGGTARGDVVWFAATNQVELVDSALRRPGRFDRIVPILPPTAQERWQILFTKLPTGTQIDQEQGAKILGLTEGYSGADLEGLIIKSREVALDRGVSEITGDDLLTALSLLRPSHNGDQVQNMIRQALTYCNDLSLVPEAWRDRIPDQP
jgi:SpoVK/Ycf46/Vps4 family AAA+-type ATPase